MKKIIIIVSILIIVLVSITYFVFDYGGNKVIQSLVDSVDSFDLVDSIPLNNTSPSPSINPSNNPTGETSQPNPNEKNTPDNSQSIDNKSDKNNPESETQKNDNKLSITDKATALSIAKSKFSASEISNITKQIQDGVSDDEMSYYKKLIKERFTAEEIEKLKDLYYKSK